MRYFIRFSYDGSCFSGFQRQKGLKTVQGEIENALFKLSGVPVNIHASGRTDKGVHAKGQCTHFDLDMNITEYNLRKYLNNAFNGEIYIKELSTISEFFHARYDVIRKTYCYYINMGDFNPVFRNYVCQWCKRLDVECMRDASLYLVGVHDFRSFCTDSSEIENSVRTIYDIDFSVRGKVLKITFVGNGFLRKMVRNIVAILLEIGDGKREPIYMKEVLDKRSRDGNLKCAFPGGLYLEKVEY
ncbi:MAG: tRNA pseudouridine(38-40) synthase TruA [bacterium]|nr:tRNA pseudouridine(38-40) synthase TruA [bacterium]